MPAKCQRNQKEFFTFFFVWSKHKKAKLGSIWQAHNFPWAYLKSPSNRMEIEITMAYDKKIFLTNDNKSAKMLIMKLKRKMTKLILEIYYKLYRKKNEIH